VKEEPPISAPSADEAREARRLRRDLHPARITAFRPLGGRGCVRRAAAEGGQTRGQTWPAAIGLPANNPRARSGTQNCLGEFT
jgi:hypothetical protein